MRWRGRRRQRHDQHPDGEQPPTVTLQRLTANNFTKQTGIKVNFAVQPESDVRDKISQAFSSQAGRYDGATISSYEVPFYAKNGWLHR